MPSGQSGSTDRAWITTYTYCMSLAPLHYLNNACQVSLTQKAKTPLSTVDSPLPNQIQVPFTCEMSFFCAACMTALAIAISSSSGWMSSSGFDLIVDSLISLQLRIANVSESSSLASISNGRTPSTKHAGTGREEVKKITLLEKSVPGRTGRYHHTALWLFLIDISCVPDSLSYFPQGGPYPGHYGWSLL